jgi:hypothetical protein
VSRRSLPMHYSRKSPTTSSRPPTMCHW